MQSNGTPNIGGKLSPVGPARRDDRYVLCLYVTGMGLCNAFGGASHLGG